MVLCVNRVVGTRVVVMAMAVGAAACPGPPRPGPGPAPEPGPELAFCPNGSTNCTNPNGTGIYPAERGHAGVGRFHMMVTQFINNPAHTGSVATVSFTARYPNPIDFPNAPVWFVLPADGGLVGSAEYRGQTGLGVVGMHETGTAVQWTLFDTQRSTEIQVGGDDLAGLTLHFQITLAVGSDSVALTFRPVRGSGGGGSHKRTPTTHG